MPGRSSAEVRRLLRRSGVLDEETSSRARERRAPSPPGGAAPAARAAPGVPPAPPRAGGGVAWLVLSVPGFLRGWQSGSCSPLGADLGAHRAPPCWVLGRTAAEAQPGDWGGKAKTAFRQRPGSYFGVVGCCLRPRQCSLGAAVRTRFPARPQSSLRTPFSFPALAERRKLAAPGRPPPPASRVPPAPSWVTPPLRETGRAPSPRLGRRLPKVNFWGRLEFRQAVKLNSRTRKRFNKEGL